MAIFAIGIEMGLGPLITRIVAVRHNIFLVIQSLIFISCSSYAIFGSYLRLTVKQCQCFLCVRNVSREDQTNA